MYNVITRETMYVNTRTHKRRNPAAATTGFLLCYLGLCWLSDDDVLSSHLQMKCEITFAATDTRQETIYNTSSTSLRVGLLRILEADNRIIIPLMTNFVKQTTPWQVICNKSKKFPKTSWQAIEKCSIINAIGVFCLNLYTNKRRRKNEKNIPA